MSPSILSTSTVDDNDAEKIQAITAGWKDTLTFWVNGSKIFLEQPDPEVTLLEYLRGIGLTGTKLGCSEGGCGACTVVVSQFNLVQNKIEFRHLAINACLAPLVSVDGKHVITVEGIGNAKNPHPVQERIAKMNGSQCGFCTPGFVMALYALIRNNPNPTEEEIEECFEGCLCRCTGYRPIIDAARTFITSAPPEEHKKKPVGCGRADCCQLKNGPEKEEKPLKRYPLPDLKPFDATTELIFPPAARKYEMALLFFGNKSKRWLRPTTLDQLVEIKSAYPSAKITGGSTEIQIEIKFKALQYALSVYAGEIEELKTCEMKEDSLEIGANVSLSQLQEFLHKAEKHYDAEKAQTCTALLRQLRYFAGPQVRNVATPAGNIATASPISDLNPVFVATGTTLYAKTTDGEISIPMKEFFKGYRRTALPPSAVITRLSIPLCGQREFVRAYKQAKRKDDDIAIANAAICLRLSTSNVVEDISIVYGGMAPTTIEAKKTIAYLQGKAWGEPEILEGAFNALELDFNLPYSVPGGMPVYRKSLALGFFFRFWHDIGGELKLSTSQKFDDAVYEIERQISKGYRDPDNPHEQKLVGKPVNHLAAMKQVTGEARYTDDIPRYHNELYGVMVLSTKAHAKLKNVNYEAALELPGVKFYVDHNDLPNPQANWWGAPSCDEIFFAVDEIFTAGQPIGLIIADTEAHARAGARAVVVEYEDLPHILTIEEAIEHNSFFPHYRFIRSGGDMDEAFAAADHIFEGVARMGGQEHFYLETQASVVVPKSEDGEMEVFSSTQNPTETQAIVAQVTGVPANRVVVRVKRLGGGFGGKESRSMQLTGILAVGANKAKAPVRCMLDRDEDIVTSGQRHPFLGRWKVGVTKEGKLLALDADIFANGGWSQDLSGAVVERSLSHVDGVYKIPNVYVRGRICKTNTVSNTAFRGFGGPQGMFICESMMSEVADRLGMSVDKFREINLLNDGDRTHFNQVLADYHIPQLLQAVREEAGFEGRRAAVDAFNQRHRYKKRGLALIPTKFGISFTAIFLNQAGALVHIYHDGSILVSHGGTEMGQGLHTKMAMIAAQELGVPLESVHISETKTDSVANTSATAASASSDLNGMAVKNACEQLNARLQPYREKLGAKATMRELAHAAYFDRVNLSANGFYKTPVIGYTWNVDIDKQTPEFPGPMFYYFTQGVALSEVEIDTLTGDFTVLRTDIKMDIGQTINAAIDYGQIEGAFVQGQGLFTTEESLWLQNGQIFTRGPGAYKIPSALDIPQDFRVSFLKNVEWKNLRTIQRSRGVGEPPLFLGSSIFFAIRDAINAARRDTGVEDVLELFSPATPERIRLACEDEIVKRCSVKPKEGEKSFFVVI